MTAAEEGEISQIWAHVWLSHTALSNQWNCMHTNSKMGLVGGFYVSVHICSARFQTYVPRFFSYCSVYVCVCVFLNI